MTSFTVFDSISRMYYPGFDSKEEAESFIRNAGLQQSTAYEVAA